MISGILVMLIFCRQRLCILALAIAYLETILTCKLENLKFILPTIPLSNFHQAIISPAPNHPRKGRFQTTKASSYGPKAVRIIQTGQS